MRELARVIAELRASDLHGQFAKALLRSEARGVERFEQVALA
jgi:hypothetical protein